MDTDEDISEKNHALSAGIQGVAALLIVAACLITFLPAIRHEFVAFDDDSTIYLNENLGFFDARQVRWAFSDHQQSHRFMPLGNLAYSLAYTLGGLHPAGFHLGSILLHTLNALLIFFLLQRLLQHLWPQSGRPLVRCAIAALLPTLWWALHPMRAEVVGWSTCLIYTVGLLFVLGAFGLYLMIERTAPSSWKRRMCIVSAGGAYTLALLTYPSAAGVVGIVIGYDFYQSFRTSEPWTVRFNALIARIRTTGIPWIIPGVVILAMAFAVTRGSEPASGPATSFLHRSLRVPLMLAHQLQAAGWPTKLSPTNDLLINYSISEPATILRIAVVVVLGAACIWLLIRGHSGLTALALGFFGVLFPLSGVTQARQFPADRYAYYAAIPLVVALAYVLVRSWRSCLVGSFALGMVITAWLPATRAQLAVWKDTETLLQHCIEQLPEESISRSTWTARLAYAGFDTTGDKQRATALLAVAKARGWIRDPAWQDLQAHIETWQPVVNEFGASPLAWSHWKLGRKRAALGDLREAVEHFLAALRISPNFQEPRLDLLKIMPEARFAEISG